MESRSRLCQFEDSCLRAFVTLYGLVSNVDKCSGRSVVPDRNDRGKATGRAASAIATKRMNKMVDRVSMGNRLGVSGRRQTDLSRGDVSRRPIPFRRLPLPEPVDQGMTYPSINLPLCLWFRAVHHQTQSQLGIANIDLGGGHGVKQTTARQINQKLMPEMIGRGDAKAPSAVVVDDAYLGGGHSARRSLDLPREWSVTGRLVSASLQMPDLRIGPSRSALALRTLGALAAGYTGVSLEDLAERILSLEAILFFDVMFGHFNGMPRSDLRGLFLSASDAAALLNALQALRWRTV
jgi:hypothetical protein